MNMARTLLCFSIALSIFPASSFAHTYSLYYKAGNTDPFYPYNARVCLFMGKTCIKETAQELKLDPKTTAELLYQGAQSNPVEAGNLLAFPGSFTANSTQIDDLFNQTLKSPFPTIHVLLNPRNFHPTRSQLDQMIQVISSNPMIARSVLIHYYNPHPNQNHTNGAMNQSRTPLTREDIKLLMNSVRTNPKLSLNMSNISWFQDTLNSNPEIETSQTSNPPTNSVTYQTGLSVLEYLMLI
jgi:hypothetical protein